MESSGNEGGTDDTNMLNREVIKVMDRAENLLNRGTKPITPTEQVNIPVNMVQRMNTNLDLNELFMTCTAQNPKCVKREAMPSRNVNRPDEIESTTPSGTRSNEKQVSIAVQGTQLPTNPDMNEIFMTCTAKNAGQETTFIDVGIPVQRVKGLQTNPDMNELFMTCTGKTVNVAKTEWDDIPTPTPDSVKRKSATPKPSDSPKTSSRMYKPRKTKSAVNLSPSSDRGAGTPDNNEPQSTGPSEVHISDEQQEFPFIDDYSLRRELPATPPPSPASPIPIDITRLSNKCNTPSGCGKEAWVTLATNDQYAMGALLVAASLRRCRTSRRIHCMITSSVSQGMRETIHHFFDAVSVVAGLDSKDGAHLAVLGRPDLGITFTKLGCWRLLQYSKCVFLDADTLVLQNCDELFDHDQLAAVPDVGWPDMFNSGVFVFTPSIHTYQALVDCAKTQGSFDGGDQGLLNTFFSDWKRLSFIYNCTSHAIYSYAAAYNKFGKNVKIIHFIGADKPWHHTYSLSTGLKYNSPSQHLQCHLEQWWRIFTADVQPYLAHEFWEAAHGHGAGWATTTNPSGDHSYQHVQRFLAEEKPEGPQLSPSSADRLHKRTWEAGFVDYKGVDSFNNIQKRLDENLKK